MIEYNVRENARDDISVIHISFGKYQEYLKYQKNMKRAFAIHYGQSDRELILAIEDIDYLIRALEKLKEISKDDKVND